MIYPSGYDTDHAYTSNQALLFGGQLYMWNRWLNVSARSHGVHDQFTRGPQNRVTLWSEQLGKEVLVTAPVGKHDRAAASDLRIADPDRWVASTRRTFQSLYGKYESYKRLRTQFEQQLGLARILTLSAFNLSFFSFVASAVEGKFTPEITDDALLKRPEGISASRHVALLTHASGKKLYLGGKAAHAAYIRDMDFHVLGVRAVDQDFTSRYVRPQGRGTVEVAPTVCVLDALFTRGSEYVSSFCKVDPLSYLACT